MPPFGLFSIFKRFEPQTVYLQGLGDFTNESTGYWCGRATFVPLGQEIDLAIKSPNEPPGIDAVNFYRKIETRWTQLWASMRQTLFAEVDDFADGATPEQLFDSLHVDAIEFWSLQEGKESWEISCTSPLDHHVFGIEMTGWEEHGFRMEG